MSSNDIDYYRARAVDEHECAAKADGESIARIHLELAEKYEALAGEARMRPDWDGPQSPDSIGQNR